MVVQTGTRNRRRIAVLIHSMTNAVIFGAGIIAVLNACLHSEPMPTSGFRSWLLRA